MPRKKSTHLFFLLGLPALLWADQLKLSNGRIYEGAVIMSDNRSVSILISDTQQVKVPHSLIASVFFRYADQVYLLSGETIKCKVLDEKLPDLLTMYVGAADAADWILETEQTASTLDSLGIAVEYKKWENNGHVITSLTPTYLFDLFESHRPADNP
jgi:hypothetical protein